MKSLVDLIAPRYMIEPAGATAETVYYDNGTARAVFPIFHGKANRIVFMRDDILMAWTFKEVKSTGGELTVEFDIP